MATIDELSVKVSADTASFMAGAEAVESQLDDVSSESLQTAAAMSVLSDRSDEAGDQISQVGRKSTAAAAQMGVLQAATNAANASFLGISATTYGALIPAVVALTAALFPVVGALGGFVAVAGSLAGVGLIPVIGAIATNTEMLRASFNQLTRTVRDEFAPVFDEAAWALVNIMGTFREVIPALVPADEVIDRLSDGFVELAEVVIEALPAFVDLAVQLADEFLPPFVEFAEDVLPDVPGMIRGLVQVFRRMIPRFARAGELLADFVPAFTELGFTVLNVLGPALTTLTRIGTDVLEWFNGLSSGVQKAGAALSLLAPILAIVAKTMGGPLLAAGKVLLSSALVPIVSSLGTFATLIGSLLSSIATFGTIIPTAVGSLTALYGITVNLIGAVGALLPSLGGVISTIGTIAALIGTGGILFVAVGAAISLFVRFQDEIRSVFDRVLPIVSGAINDALNWLRTTGANLAGRAMEIVGSAIRTALLEVKAMIMNPSESVIINAVKGLSQWLQNNGPGLLKKAWNAIVEVGLAAFRGLKRGLIGNSIIPEMISDIKDAFFGFANWVKTTFTDVISNVFGGVAQAIGNAFATFEIDWPPAFQQIIDFFGGSIAKALEFIDGKIDINPPDDGDGGEDDPPDGRDPPDDDDPPEDDDPPGGGCFVGETPIATREGEKEISNITPGDKVISYDAARGELTESVVGETITHRDDHDYDRHPLLAVTVAHSTDDVSTTHVTANHRYLTTRGEWHQIGETSVGECLVTRNGIGVIISKRELDSPDVIYNLHMRDGPHNYLANGAVVHNAKTGPRAAARGVMAQATPIMPADTRRENRRAVADGFDNSQVAQQMRDTLNQIDQSVRDDGTVRVREQDIVRGLERIFDRQNGSL